MHTQERHGLGPVLGSCVTPRNLACTRSKRTLGPFWAHKGSPAGDTSEPCIYTSEVDLSSFWTGDTSEACIYTSEVDLSSFWPQTSPRLAPSKQSICTSKVDLDSFWAPVRPLSSMHIHERIGLGSILGLERSLKSLNRTKQSKTKQNKQTVTYCSSATSGVVLGQFWAQHTLPYATPLQLAGDLKPPSETHMRPHFRDQTNRLPRKMVYLLHKLTATLSYGHSRLTPAAGLREAS